MLLALATSNHVEGVSPSSLNVTSTGDISTFSATMEAIAIDRCVFGPGMQEA
jgi:hypothetical protein